MFEIILKYFNFIKDQMFRCSKFTYIVYNKIKLLIFISFLVFFNSSSIRSQTQVPPPQLFGRTQTVSLSPWRTTYAGRIEFILDSDNDGMPDTWEQQFNFNPNNPADADQDPDNDGLRNGDEFRIGTNPRLADTDGDGFSDGEEVRLGYNPLDPNSRPPQSGPVLVSLRVTPNPLQLSRNALLGALPVQLQVQGVLSNNQTIDLTTNPATTYQSSDTSIATVDSRGVAVGVAGGSTVIRVRNTTFSTDVPTTVANFVPGVIATLPMPGFANRVDISGTFAYVACGAAGLQVVDISVPELADVVGSVAVGGNANDVRVVGNRAFVAAGNGGLQIVDISTPTSPRLLGGIVFPQAFQVCVRGNNAYVASGSSGLRIIDIANPAAPTIVATIPVRSGFFANGVDVDARGIAVVAVGDNLIRIDTGFGEIQTIDVSNPTFPRIRATSTLSFLSNPFDVVFNGSVAYVASGIGGVRGLITVETANPDSPVVSQTTDFAFGTSSIKIAAGFAFASCFEFAQANVPLFSLVTPNRPAFVGTVNFNSPLIYGTGVGATENLVLLATNNVFPIVVRGENGNSVLLIGRYRQVDASTVQPALRTRISRTGFVGTAINGMIAGINIPSGAVIEVRANGSMIGTASTLPFSFTLPPPTVVGTILVEARAVPPSGPAITAPPVTVQIGPAPVTTVVGLVVNSSGVAEANARVTLLPGGQIGSTNGQGIFSISNVTAPNPSTDIFARAVNAGGTQLGQSDRPSPGNPNFVSGGTTNLGILRLNDFRYILPTANVPLVASESINLGVCLGNCISGSIVPLEVEFLANGSSLGRTTNSPYDFNYTVPGTVGGTLRFDARAVPLGGGNSVVASQVNTTIVTTDPLTTVVGRIVDDNGAPVAGARVRIGSLETMTNSQGTFTIASAPTVPLSTPLQVTAVTADGTRNASASKLPVRGGTTDFGNIPLVRTGS